MNRTVWLLSFAAVLAVAALVSSPRSSTPQSPQSPQTRAVLDNLPAVVPGLVHAEAVTASATASPGGPLSLKARLASTHVAAGDSETVAVVDVKAARSEVSAPLQRLPVNLAVAIDRSGSMHGDKLEQAKHAARTLVQALHDGDRLAIVSFGGNVSVFASTEVNGASRARMLEFVEGIVESGDTNISGALDEANAQLRSWQGAYRVSRVILLSDGQPTSGITDTEQLWAQVAASREQGVTTSAFGVGLDFNAALMRGLAGRGAGFYAFIEDASHLSDIFEKDLGTASSTVARKVALEVTPAPGVTLVDVPGQAWSRTGGGGRVPLYDFSPEQTARTLLRLKLAGAPTSGAVQLVSFKLTYLDLVADSPREASVNLSAEATSSAAAVTAGADPEVAELAKRVIVAEHMAVAAAAYERGDKETAFNAFDNVRRMFGMSADALGGDAKIEKRMRAGSTDGVRAAKELTDKSMKNFGQNNAY